MTGCTRLSDRMVAVLHGGESWTADEQGHLVACGDCAAEWRLVRAAAGFGASVSVVDPDQVAARVSARLVAAAAEGKGRIPLAVTGRVSRLVIALAAAAAILLAVQITRSGRPSGPVSVTGSSVLQELDDLSITELETVLDVFGGANGPTMPADAPPLGDLNSDELERILRSWEG